MDVSGADASGAEMRATELTFRPGTVRPSNYRFAVGTAGSATLVLQTILPPLLLADGPSKLLLEGGTHNPFAPPFDFLDKAFLPLLRRMGAGVTAILHKPGFYPAGGGRFAVEISPTEQLQPIELLTRGALRKRKAVAVVSNLPITIAERELAIVTRRLGWSADDLDARQEKRTAGPGNVLLLSLNFENVTEVFTGFGQTRVRAEKVAEDTVKLLQRYQATEAVVGPLLADQLLLPLALAGGGSFTTLPPSKHTLTNIDVIRKFMDLELRTEKVASNVYRVSVG